MTPDQFRQAADLGVLVRQPYPSAAQWAAIARELLAQPVETMLWPSVWWLAYARAPLVVTRGPLSDHPGFGQYKGKTSANGVLWDVNGALYTGDSIIVTADACYPETAGGVAYMGLSTVVHEWAHLLDHRVGAHFNRGVKFSDLPEWRAVFGSVRWWQPEPHPGEAWADGWAAWGQYLAGNPLGRLHPRCLAPAFRPVWDYFHATTDAVGWRVPRRAT